MDFIEYIQSTSLLGETINRSSTFSWIFWALMSFNLFAIAYIRTMHSGYLSVLFRTGIYNRQLYQNVQEDLRLNTAGSVFLTMAYFNSFAAVIFNLMSGVSHQFLFWLMLISAGVIVVKFALIYMLGFLFETNDGLAEHRLNHLVYFQIIAVLLTPVLCLTYFSSDVLKFEMAWIQLGFIGLMIFFRDLQTFIRVLRLRISMIYIILYLCTLELIPLVVLIKVLIR